VNHEPAVLIVADDLSGAADSAVALANHANTAVLLDAEADWPRATVVAIDTDTRYMDAEAAAEHAAAAVRRSGAGTLVYKKIDSTLRGNIGPEVAGALAALAERHGRRHLAVIAPAFPATGRTVLGGRVLVGEEPVEERYPGRRPLTEQLKEAGLAVELLSLEELRDGDPARFLAAAAGRADAVVVDALTDDDLALTVKASSDLPALLVGSGGLAHRLGPLPAIESAGEESAAAAPQRTGPALVCVGSRSSQAQAQCRTLIAELPAVPVQVTSAPDGVDSAARELRGALSTGHDAVVFLDPAQVVEPSRAQEFAGALAEVARAGLDRAGALIATGGETARAVLLSVGVRMLAVEGEIEPGVVCMRTPEGLTVITKAGAFGDPGTLLRAARMLGRGERPGAPKPAAPATDQQDRTSQGTPAVRVLPGSATA
jgi:uncharacterized protein YgbK (DUF1537 family)